MRKAGRESGQVIILKKALLVIACAAGICGARTADFLVIFRPSAVSLLDKFESPLSNERKAELGTNLPLRIEDLTTTLGDGITPAARVSLLGQTLYLLRDEKGNIAGAHGNSSLLRNCSVENDTLEVGSGGKLYPQYSLSGNPQSVTTGTLVLVVFRYSGKRFVKVLDKPLYGWFSGNAHPPARSEIAGGRGISRADRTTERIIARIDEANAAYRQFFDHFNKRTGRRKTAPQWECSLQGSGMQCRLTGPSGAETFLSASTEELVQDLKEICLGGALSVRHEQGELFIGPAKQ